MRKIFKVMVALPAFITLFSCAGVMQSASVMEAYKKYDAEQYEDTLVLIMRAENSKAAAPYRQAELAFLKAQTHERLGNIQVAKTLYEYLVAEHGSTQYGYLSRAKVHDKL